MPATKKESLPSNSITKVRDISASKSSQHSIRHETSMSFNEKSFHMTPDEFRRYGHAVVDWIADYQSRVESFPVLSQVKPGDVRAALPAEPPAQGEAFEAVMKDVDRVILPGITHWQSPNF